MNSISILLADDNPVFLRIAEQFLKTQENIVIVGTASNGREAIARCRSLRPEVILIDLSMPEMSGLEAIPVLRADLPDATIIALTLLGTDSYRQASMTAGADAFVPKAKLSTDLLPAIHSGRRAGTLSQNLDREILRQ